jgi:hypothetical protein
MTIYTAELETERFTFRGTGLTAASAKGALVKGLAKHAKDYGLASNWWKPYECDMFIHPAFVGTCTRDNEIL